MKEEKYKLLVSQIEALIEGEKDTIAVMSNVAAAIQCGWSGIVFPGNAEDLIIKMQHAGIILKP